MPREFTRYALIAAGFAIGLQVALVIAGFGFVYLLTGIQPIGDPEAGVVVGPMAVGVSTLAFGAVLLAIALSPPERQRVRIWAGLIAGVVAWAGYVIAGTIGLGAVHGELGTAAAAMLGGGFAWIVLVAGCLVGTTYTWVLASRREGRGRPRWPWEDDADE
ncbi:DUF6121 family protein [Agromyces seonyuensis]|uniref:Uncharacterized protein n=1 Tax=Agromyces seonyuensis TaxID=2662446 RepID=A0A6I4P321_9MICO|nr:hypothetical protein [Agromyces seonyuensis]MWB99185.1 hypothetical protein [Agromyces seonyuensis]